jgi:hypothetical protein
MTAAKSSTVATLGPMALRVVRAGLDAADIVAGAAAAAMAGADEGAAKGVVPPPAMQEALCTELQTAFQTVKKAKKARMQVRAVGWAVEPNDRLGWRGMNVETLISGNGNVEGKCRHCGDGQGYLAVNNPARRHCRQPL